MGNVTRPGILTMYTRLIYISVVRLGGRYPWTCGEDDVRPKTERDGTAHLRGSEKEGDPGQVSN